MPRNPNEYYVRVLPNNAPSTTARSILEHNLTSKKEHRIIRETYLNATLLFCNTLETLNSFKP